MRVSAIIYERQSGIIKRIVVSDSVDKLAAPSVLGIDETCIIIDPDEIISRGDRSMPDISKCYTLIKNKRAVL